MELIKHTHTHRQESVWGVDEKSERALELELECGDIVLSERAKKADDSWLSECVWCAS